MVWDQLGTRIKINFLGRVDIYRQFDSPYITVLENWRQQWLQILHSKNRTHFAFRSATVRLSTNSNSTGGNPSMIAAPETRLHHCTNRTLDNQLKTRRKVAKMLIVVVVMFSLNMFPVHMLPIVNVIEISSIKNTSVRTPWIRELLSFF